GRSAPARRGWASAPASAGSPAPAAPPPPFGAPGHATAASSCSAGAPRRGGPPHRRGPYRTTKCFALTVPSQGEQKRATNCPKCPRKRVPESVQRVEQNGTGNGRNRPPHKRATNEIK